MSYILTPNGRRPIISESADSDLNEAKAKSKPLSSWPKVHAAVHRSFSQAGGTGSEAEKHETGKHMVHPDFHAAHDAAEKESKHMKKAVDIHYSKNPELSNSHPVNKK